MNGPQIYQYRLYLETKILLIPIMFSHSYNLTPKIPQRIKLKSSDPVTSH